MVYLPLDSTIPLVASVDNTVLIQNLQTLAQDFHVYGIRAMVTYSDVTAGDAPIEAGWAQSQLTAAEILECRDATPTSQWDVPATEQARRKVRAFGTSSGVPSGDSLNDGKPVWRRMFLRIPAGQIIANTYAINRANQTLTTGQLVHFQGVVIGKWA